MTANLGETDCLMHMPQALSDGTPNPFGIKCVAYEMPDTSDGGGALVIDMDHININQLFDIWMFEHSTTDDVIITNSGTAFVSSLTGNKLTITFFGAENKKRVAVVWGTDIK